MAADRVALLFAGGGVVAYQALDRELIPAEDRGIINIFASGPDGVGINYMDRQTDQSRGDRSTAGG